MEALIEAMLREVLADPGRALLATLVLLCLVMVIPLVAALRRRARETREKDDEKEREARRRRQMPDRFASEPREPRFESAARSYYADDDDEDEDDEDDAPETAHRRIGFGAGPPKRRKKDLPVRALTKFVWFGLGILVGAGSMAVSNSIPAIGEYLFMPIDVGPEETAQSAPPPQPTKDNSGRLPQEGAEDPVRVAEEALAKTSSAQTPADQTSAPAAVDKELAEFVSGMQAQLPMAIGRDIQLVKVTSEGRVVTLAFAIAQAIPESDYGTLQKTLQDRFRAGICAGNDQLRIRRLNEAGVSFTVYYTDIVGQTVAYLEMVPQYCSTVAKAN